MTEQQEIQQLRQQLLASQAKIFNICDTWQSVKKYVPLINTLLFFSKKARNIFSIFVTAADGICPAQDNG